MAHEPDPAGLPKLPHVILRYLDFERSRDVPGQLALFTAEAVVRDEERTYQGHDALKAWKQEAHSKFNYTIDPIHATIEGNTVVMLAKLSGNFPGSPVEINHTFVLDGDKIAALTIE